MATLATLTSEPLARILDLLEAKHVLHLLTTGCPLLRAHVLQNARNIFARLRPFDLFPSFALLLPYIHSIQVLCESNENIKFLRLQHAHADWLVKSETLVSLKLGFMQASALLGTNERRLSQLYPNLRTLELNGLMKPITDSFMRYLPESLETLILRPYKTTRDILVPAALLYELPRSLTSLEVASVVINCQEADFKQSSPLPPLLRSLRLIVLGPFDLLLHLPQSLELLEVDFSNPMPTEPVTLKSSEILPPSITSFTVSVWRPSHIQGARTPQFVLDVDQPLPKSLTELHSPRFKSDNFDIGSLKNLPLFAPMTPTKELLNRDIHSASTLHFDFLTEDPQIFAKLPPNLESLTLSCFIPFTNETPALPSTLTSFDGPLAPSQVCLLPKGLRKLILGWVPPRIPLVTFDDLLDFPPRLQELSLQMSSLEDHRCLKALKTRFLELRTLWLYGVPEEAFDDASFGGSFPLSLTNLTLRALPNCSEIDVYWVQNLKRLAQLRSLTISAPLPLEMDNLGEVFANFPSESLTELTLVGVPPQFEVSAFSHLPRHLESIVIMQNASSQVQRGDFTGITDQHLDGLPLRLSRLILNLITQNLTEGYYTHLPRFLLDFKITSLSDVGEAGRRRYYDDPNLTGSQEPNLGAGEMFMRVFA